MSTLASLRLDQQGSKFAGKHYSRTGLGAISSLSQLEVGPGSILNSAETIRHIDRGLRLTSPSADWSKLGETCLFGLWWRFEDIDLVQCLSGLWGKSYHCAERSVGHDDQLGGVMNSRSAIIYWSGLSWRRDCSDDIPSLISTWLTLWKIRSATAICIDKSLETWRLIDSKTCDIVM